ncbi:biotin--[acetyl-CoA-carboxylase] ligase [Brevundimonas sp.]|uniref:biotin--[acetyl-CoA-carboxylase] ligase n=1 Tax=Brevundimonas sp. TaxID=1871086 RepID=UPI0035B327E8
MSPGASSTAPAETPVVWFDRIDSTNAEARRRAEAGEGGPLWLAARAQDAGRGRRARAWTSEPGNLFATLLTSTRRPAAEAAQVSFLAALAVAELLDAFTEAGRVAIKWPNDVLLDGKKASGILIESGQRAQGGVWLAIGIGVNLAHAPDDTERPAIALAQALRPDLAHTPTPEMALTVLADSLAAWMGRWDAYGFAPVLDAWTRRAGGLQGPCVARLDHETLAGTAEGVAEDGSLRLRLGDGSLRLISAGDVFFGQG